MTILIYLVMYTQDPLSVASKTSTQAYQGAGSTASIASAMVE